MKPIYVICAVLGITIGSLLTASGASPGLTTANNNSVASGSSTATPAPVAVTIAKNDSDLKATTNEGTTTAIPGQNSSVTDKTSSKVTTASTAVTTAPTKPPTTKAPDTTTALPTTNATTTSTTTTTTTTVTPPVTSPVTTAAPTAAVVTTALPPSTASPSKDRHFDGLSFFGGIILATCLMAVAAFSWKFYRQCNERNYRTL